MRERRTRNTRRMITTRSPSACVCVCVYMYTRMHMCVIIIVRCYRSIPITFQLLYNHHIERRKKRKREREKKRTSIHSLVLSRFALERKREGEKIQSKDTNDCSMHHHHHHHYYRCCTTTKTRRNAAFI